MRASAVVAVALMLAACTGGDEDVTPSPTPSPDAPPVPSPSPEPSPSPSPEPVFDPHPPLASLVVTAEGILPLAIGEPLDTNPGAAMVFLEPDYCYNEIMGITEGDLDRWLANYSMGMHPDGFEMRPFAVDVAVGFPLWRIDVATTELATPEGIRIGSTLAELQATYPDLVAGTPSGISKVWWIEGVNGYLVFETQDDSDGLQPPGTPETVILMRVIWNGTSPDFASANSGDVAGACF